MMDPVEVFGEHRAVELPRNDAAIGPGKRLDPLLAQIAERILGVHQGRLLEFPTRRGSADLKDELGLADRE